VVCPRWTGGSPEKNTGGDGGSGARGEIRMQERAKWRERELLKVLDQKRRGEACTGASHDGGEVAAGQCSGRGGVAWRAREKARGEGLRRGPAWGRCVGAARGRRRHRQSCSGGERWRPATAEGEQRKKKGGPGADVQTSKILGSPM
jgi:hypothetical protein